MDPPLQSNLALQRLYSMPPALNLSTQRWSRWIQAILVVLAPQEDLLDLESLVPPMRSTPLVSTELTPESSRSSRDTCHFHRVDPVDQWDLVTLGDHLSRSSQGDHVDLASIGVPASSR